MMSMALLLSKSLRLLTLSGVIDSTVSAFEEDNALKICIQRLMHFFNHHFVINVNARHCLSCFVCTVDGGMHVCAGEQKVKAQCVITAAVQTDTWCGVCLTAVQSQFRAPLDRQELHMFLCLLSEVLLLHLPHSFPQPEHTKHTVHTENLIALQNVHTLIKH